MFELTREQEQMAMLMAENHQAVGVAPAAPPGSLSVILTPCDWCPKCGGDGCAVEGADCPECYGTGRVPNGSPPVRVYPSGTCTSAPEYVLTLDTGYTQRPY